MKLAKLPPEEVELLNCAIQLLQNIKARRLAVKAFQVQRRYPADPLENVDAQKNGLTDFLNEIEHPENCEEFRQKLLAEIGAILKILNGCCPSHTVIETSVTIRTLGQIPGGSQIARAYLLPSFIPTLRLLPYTPLTSSAEGRFARRALAG